MESIEETGNDYVPEPDYGRLADWPSIERYFKAVDAASDRVQLVDAGPTTEGRRIIAAIVSAPANIRELETTVSRAALSARDGVVRARDLQFLHPVSATHQADAPLLVPLRDVERDHIRRVLEALDWNKKRAAQVLQISRETLYRKIGEFALVQERRA